VRTSDPAARHRARPVVPALLVALSLLGGCSGGLAEQAAGPRGSIPWASCGGGFECATLPVPLDHADPQGERIELALVRLPATRPSERQGSLVVNPGGPGGSGVDFVRGAAASDYFGAEVRARFDIVGFDPRGVGRSTAVDCGDEGLEASEDVVFPPRTDADREALSDAVRRAVAACQEDAGALLNHLATESAARDLDLLRSGLGEERLTYHGVSYGTFLGATYAALHPDRVRAMVLDAALDPASWQGDGAHLARATTAGFDRALTAFFDGCRRHPDTCSFGDGDPAAAFDRLMQSLRSAPSGGDAPPVDRDLVLAVTMGALYDDASWPQLADALARAEQGDVNALRKGMGRPWDGALATFPDAYFAIRCSDQANPPDQRAAETLARELVAVNPHFGPFWAYGDVVCAFWPTPASRYTGPYTAEGAPPILVLGTTGDPATPVGHARALAEDLSSGVLVVRDGDGHGAYGADNECIDATVDDYLLRLAVPQDGLTCPR